jgi:hypothetical protein
MSMSTLNTRGQSLGEGSTGTLKEWKSMYESENLNYDSASMYAEVRYLELKSRERESGKENNYQGLISCIHSCSLPCHLLVRFLKSSFVFILCFW